MRRYEQKKSKRNVSVLLIMVIVFLVLFFVWNNQKQQASQEKEITTIDIPVEKPFSILENQILLNNAVKQESTEPNQEIDRVDIPKVKPILPNLENSDTDFKIRLEAVSKSLTDWFAIQHSIKKYIVIINDLSHNQIIFKHRSFLKMPEKIIVQEDAQGLYLATESYRRFDTLANAIGAIDVKKGLELFLLFKPLFDQVFKEFAYPAEYKLEDIFLKAAASVIEAPVIETRLALNRDSVRYKYSDIKVESLNAVKKQMLRMGPENTKKIQAKLRELVEAVAVYNE